MEGILKTKLNKKWELPLFFLTTNLLMIFCVVLYKLLGWQMFSVENLKIGPAIVWFFMIFSPTLSAFLLTFIFSGKNGLQKLLKNYTKFKTKWYWYLAAFALILVPLIISYILSLLNLGAGSGFDNNLTISVFLAYLIFNFFSGPFAEEAGWRGYALPRLQAKHNSLVSSLILGFFWTLWHVPLIFVVGADQASLGLFGWIIYTILIFTITIILTWLYNNTKGSFVIVILAHFCFNVGSNITINMLGFVDSMFYNIIGGVSGVFYLLVIFIGFGYKRFSKLPESELPIYTPNSK